MLTQYAFSSTEPSPGLPHHIFLRANGKVSYLEDKGEDGKLVMSHRKFKLANVSKEKNLNSNMQKDCSKQNKFP